MIKKILFFFLILCLLPFTPGYAAECGNDLTGETPDRTIEQKTYPLYYERNGTDPVNPEFPVYFIDGVYDFPYADITDIVTLENDMKDAVNFGGLTYFLRKKSRSMIGKS